MEDGDYYKTATTTDLWRHKWQPIQFVLIVDDFGVEYVGEEHAVYLATIFKLYYKISEDWVGK